MSPQRGLAAYVKSLHKEPIYWGVDLDRTIPADIIVQAWHPGESLKAIRRGFRTINSNCHDTYINRPAGSGDPDTGALPGLPIERVYAFDPVPAEATEEQARLVLGSEASLWTERVPEERVTTKMFPRLFAFAEALWSPPRPRNIGEFRTLLAPQLARLDPMKVGYFDAPPAAPASAKPATPAPAAGGPMEPLPPPIGVSRAMPVVGQPVLLSVHGATGGICAVLGPRGDAKELGLSAMGQASWTPTRYGKRVLRCQP